MADSGFERSPLSQQRLQFAPRVRAAMQIIISSVLVAALYAAFKSTPRILADTEWSGARDAPDIPGWIMLLVPIIAVVPGAYVFLFLKYNFNRPMKSQ